MTSPRCGRRRCKPPTSRVLYSPLSPEATPKNMCHVLWGFRLLFACRARYCIRPTAAGTLEHEETYSCCLWLSENFGLKGFGCSRSCLHRECFLICWKVEKGYHPLRSASIWTREVTVLEMLMLVILKFLFEPKTNCHLLCT